VKEALASDKTNDFLLNRLTLKKFVKFHFARSSQRATLSAAVDIGQLQEWNPNLEIMKQSQLLVQTLGSG
jgi:hypothetical protein